MKKSAIVLSCALSAAVLAFAAGCGETAPAGLSFAGDLQELYGGGNGYPQAVLVGKKSVLESDAGAAGTLLSYFDGSDGFLSAHSGQEIAELLAGKYAAGQTPSINANNLTKDVIKNCSVRFTRSADCKTAVNDFLAKLIAVNPAFTSPVEDAFFEMSDLTAGASANSYTVYAPDGAPALSLANAISSTEGNAFEYHIVAANTIAAQVTGESPKADFCVLPVNAAAKLLGKGTTYRMLGTVTNGNLYLLASGKQQKLTKDNLDVLKGKTVGVVQIANVPGLTLQAVLKDKGIEYAVLENDAAPEGKDKVFLKPIADAASGVTPAGGCDYYLCAEPLASAKVSAFKK